MHLILTPVFIFSCNNNPGFLYKVHEGKYATIFLYFHTQKYNYNINSTKHLFNRLPM